MTNNPGMSTATAILLGSGMIAVALFLGLSRMQAAPPAPVEPATVRAAAPAGAPPPTATQEEVLRQAQEALAYQRDALVTSCRPGPGEQHRFVLNVTFDAAGAEVMRGIVEDRSNPSPGIAQCVAQTLKALRIPPPGATTLVDVPLRVP